MFMQRHLSYVAVFYRTWFGMERVKRFYYTEYEWRRAIRHLPMSRGLSRRIARVKRVFGVETRFIWG